MSRKLSIILHSMGIAIILTLIIVAVSGCIDDFRYKGPCRAPGKFTKDDVLGRWQALYVDYQSPYFVPNTPDPVSVMILQKEAEKISGADNLTFYKDGTYIQHFQGDGFEYRSRPLRWELDKDNFGRPKLVMYGLRYFAFGLSNAEGPLYLQPQNVDQIWYQKQNIISTESNQPIIAYPSDGYIFLYPRSCLGKTVLVQMVGINCCDPDNLAVVHPVFEKRPEE